MSVLDEKRLEDAARTAWAVFNEQGSRLTSMEVRAEWEALPRVTRARWRAAVCAATLVLVR